MPFSKENSNLPVHLARGLVELPDLPKTECRNRLLPGPTHSVQNSACTSALCTSLTLLPSHPWSFSQGSADKTVGYAERLAHPPEGTRSKHLPCFFAACKRKEQEHGKDRGNTPKKPRLVFTDVQRRTLHAIFKENKRPSKELQITISQQLGLELSTVSNFFMNARRRSLDKWQDEASSSSGNSSSSSSTCTKAWRKNHGLEPRWKSFKFN